MNRYYRYDGSLTTPPCYESVIWSILDEPLYLSLEQLRAFQSLYDQHGKLLMKTYRLPQPLGTRKLFRSFYYQDKSKDRKSTDNNHGSYMSVNIKIVFVLISFLMINV